MNKNILFLLFIFSLFTVISMHAQSQAQDEFEQKMQKQIDQNKADYEEARNGTATDVTPGEMFDYTPPSTILWVVFLVAAIYVIIGLMVVTAFRDTPFAVLGHLYGFQTFDLLQDEKMVIVNGLESQNYELVESNGWHARFW
jgi:hypothetical protein